MNTTETILVVILFVLVLLIYITSIANILKSKILSQREKPFLVFLVLVLPVVGSMLYYLFFKPERYRHRIN